MLDYWKRHHVGLLALFIALGGTSYAAVSLPRNSVGSTQLRKGAVTESKLSSGVRKKLGKAGKQGPAGSQGAKGETGATGAQGPVGAAGPTGDTGPKGDAGAQGIQGLQGDKGDPGPTAAAIGGINTTVTVSGLATQIGSPTTITLATAGKLLVQLHGTFGLTCGGASCSRTVGVLVDGQSVTGAFAIVDSTSNATNSDTVTASGILSGVAVGAHTVSIGGKTSGSPSALTSGGDIRVVAVALGG